VAKTRSTAEWQVYLVGGAVRDELLGRPVRERDWVVVGATADALLARGFRQVGRDFPVFLHPQTHEEYALARTERKTAAGHTGFECYAGVDVTLEQDLARRDLTVNAIARTKEGQLVDPFGGRRDLNARWLRHVSAAFVEDPLRIFRVARFAAELAPYDFRVAPETAALMRQMADRGALRELAAERVWHELAKALAAPAPERFFGVLQACGGLADWFEELIPVASRIAEVLACAEAPVERFAALCWLLPSNGVDDLCRRLKAPREHIRWAGNIARHGRSFARWRALPAQELLDALTACGAFRQVAEFDRLLRLTAALGEAPLDDLQACVARLRAISSEPFRTKGLSGAELGSALRAARLALLEAAT